MSEVHEQSESSHFRINIADHAQRTDSAEFRHAKVLAHRILATISNFFDDGTSTPIQLHHAGSLWVHDKDGWFMLKNLAGIEWSAQFCADPAKVEKLRINALRLYNAFPDSIPQMVKLGYQDTDILTTEIKTQDDISRWVDSIFNSCIPLPAHRHTATLMTGAGVHHYPTPVTDIDLIKRDDFVLWVTDEQSGHQVAVVPTAPLGSGVATTRLVYAPIGTELHDKHVKARLEGAPLELDSNNTLSKQAFKHQK